MVGRWSVRRARWAGLLGLLLCVGGTASVLCGGLLLIAGPPLTWAALSVAVLAAGWAGYRIVNSPVLAGTLSLRDCGLWEVALPGTKKTMRLIHAWSAFGWVTLQFRDSASSGSKQPLELVVWKESVTRQEWSELLAHVAGQIALPGRILQKESL